MASMALGMIGQQVGGPIGGMIGSTLGNLLFNRAEDTSEESFGPRIENRSVQISSYGEAIPRVFGVMRMAGNMIWLRDNEIDETIITESTTTEQPKGLFDGPEHTSTVTTYTYSARFAVLLCEGPITAVLRIWWNGNLVWDRRQGTAFGGSLPITFYTGTDTQLPDPTLEEHFGVGNVPAMRGKAYVVFKDIQLADGGNTIGNWEFEVSEGGNTARPAAEIVAHPDGYGQAGMGQDPRTGLIWTGAGKLQEGMVFDPVTKEVVATFPGIDQGLGFTRMEGSTSSMGFGYQPPLQFFDVLQGEMVTIPARMWTGGGGLIPAQALAYDADTYEIVGASGGVHYQPTQFLYDESTGLVLASGTGGVSTINPFNFSSTILTPTPGWPAIFNTKICYEWGYVAFCGDEKIYLTALGDPSYTRIAEFIIPWWGNISLNVNMAYDPGRGRLWPVWSINGNGRGYLDLSTLTVVSIPGDTYNWSATTLYIPDLDAILLGKGSFAEGPYIGSTLYLFSASDGSLIRTVGVMEFISGEALYVPEGGALWFYQTAGGIVKRVWLDALTDATDTTVRAIVEKIGGIVGLQEDEIDASALGEPISGYLIAEQMTARRAIEGLQGYSSFGGVESDTQITFPLRAGSSIRTLDEDDLVVSGSDDRGTYFSARRTEETELPKEVSVTFVSKALDYHQSTHRARRIATRSENIRDTKLAINMTDDKAKQKAAIMLDAAWIERNVYEFTTNYKHADLNPLDVIKVDLDSNIYEMIIEQIAAQPAGNLKISARSREGGSYTNTDTASASDSPYQSAVIVKSNSQVHLADIPYLVDAHAGKPAGFYLFANPFTGEGSWRGAMIYQSDDGTAWSELTSELKDTPSGSVLTSGALLPSNEFATIDRESTLSVRVTTGTLSSVPEDELYQGKNAALWGNEIVQYATATLEADGSYTLSGFLRGRRGTENSTRHPNVGERFIVLNHPVQRVPTDSTLRDIERLYRPVTIGRSFSTGFNIPFTNTEAGLKPYAPTAITGTWDAPSTDDITIDFVPRTRTGAQRLPEGTTITFADAADYEIDILDDAGAVVRAVTGLTSPTYAYTSAMQTTDFGAARDWIHVKVYHKSAQVGRGFAGEAWLNGPDAVSVYEDFSGFTVGVTPSGWTLKWGLTVATVETDATANGGKSLQLEPNVSSPSVAQAIAMPDTEFRDPRRQVLFRVKKPAGAFGGAGPYGATVYLIANGDRATDTWNFIRWSMSGDGLGYYLERYSSASPQTSEAFYTAYTFSLDEWYWVRAEIDGNIMRAKVWADAVGVIEPSGWSIEQGTTLIPSTGWIGFGARHFFEVYHLDSIRISYGGAYA